MGFEKPTSAVADVSVFADGRVEVDPRLALPLGTIKFIDHLPPDALENLKKEEYPQSAVFSATLPAAVKAHLQEELADTNWEHNYDSVPLDNDGTSPVHETLTHVNRPTISDWKNLNDHAEYQFAQSWHYRGVVLSFAAISVLALVEAVLTISGFGYSSLTLSSGYIAAR